MVCCASYRGSWGASLILLFALPCSLLLQGFPVPGIGKGPGDISPLAGTARFVLCLRCFVVLMWFLKL
ncbi:hypothetical protein V8C42DRAFT_303727 [Trichoderma barbatum]